LMTPSSGAEGGRAASPSLPITKLLAVVIHYLGVVTLNASPRREWTLGQERYFP
jgi:hypothetical protein